ncbi:HAD family hydrolase [Streptomyces sp. SID3343]|uniref:HAD family hydrolase n=1 Tax=Streptomyces sp. SID3343 TaxID=2690260 RepID=UPI0013684E00|nr:HAD family hydrolase [Streptomyces sp. SID3343]MYW00993.1 HAD-IA family hydrolase [Streptomyces sp. SID3343]
MSLLMLDLDNTLVDRDAAFRGAVVAFLAEHGLPGDDVDWLMSIDASGYTSRLTVAATMAERYGSAAPDGAVRALLDHGAADRVTLAGCTRDALDRAIAAGWSCVIVTNGRTAQQESKIRRAGLDRLVHGWVVSEHVGHPKPEPEIFRAAAATVGASLVDAWMIGDSGPADIAGANGLSIRSVWVSAGRPWTEAAYRPTHVTDDIVAAIDHVVGAPAPSQRTDR